MYTTRIIFKVPAPQQARDKQRNTQKSRFLCQSFGAYVVYGFLMLLQQQKQQKHTLTNRLNTQRRKSVEMRSVETENHT